MRAANGIAETTVSIAGTMGDGAITTTAIANTPRVSHAFGTGAVTVRYAIAQASTGALETGIGSFTSNVLTRTKPLMTWSGSAWVSTGTISPLQFGSTPTSGDVVIRLAPLAEAMAPIMPGRNSTVAGHASWRDYPISQSFINWSNNGSGVALTAGKEYYIYYRSDVAGDLIGVQFEVTTLVAASSMKLALYSIGSDGLPAHKIVDFNTAATDTTGIKTDTATATWSTSGSVSLSAGWYAIGIIASAAISIRGMSASSPYSGPTPLGRAASYGWASAISIAGNYTTGLPAVANTSGGALTNAANGDNFLWLGLRIS